MLFAASAMPSRNVFFMRGVFDFDGSALLATNFSGEGFSERFVRVARSDVFFIAGMDAGFVV
jgi:hypothetical protein